jgi:predicted nucleic acid-binding protein
LIVVDTNVLAYLLLRGPRTEQAEILRRHHRQWAAPPLWRSEFRNVLTGYLRRDRLQLVSSSHCSACDCEFVAVAQHLGVPLITEDRAILTAFPDLAQSLHQATS